MIDPDIKNRLDQLSPTYIEFVKSNFAHEAAQAFGAEAGLDEDKIMIFSNGIMLYLLVFLDFEEFVAFITEQCEITSEQAAPLAGAVLASLPETFTILHQQALDILSPATPENENDLEADIAETEAALNNSPHIRTMQEDMAASPAPDGEIVYSTTQAAILKEGTNPTPNNAPQWESESK